MYRGIDRDLSSLFQDVYRMAPKKGQLTNAVKDLPGYQTMGDGDWVESWTDCYNRFQSGADLWGVQLLLAHGIDIFLTKDTTALREFLLGRQMAYEAAVKNARPTPEKVLLKMVHNRLRRAIKTTVDWRSYQERLRLSNLEQAKHFEQEAATAEAAGNLAARDQYLKNVKLRTQDAERPLVALPDLNGANRDTILAWIQENPRNREDELRQLVIILENPRVTDELIRSACDALFIESIQAE